MNDAKSHNNCRELPWAFVVDRCVKQNTPEPGRRVRETQMTGKWGPVLSKPQHRQRKEKIRSQKGVRQHRWDVGKNNREKELINDTEAGRERRKEKRGGKEKGKWGGKEKKERKKKKGRAENLTNDTRFLGQRDVTFVLSRRPRLRGGSRSAGHHLDDVTLPLGSNLSDRQPRSIIIEEEICNLTCTRFFF